LPSDFTKR